MRGALVITYKVKNVVPSERSVKCLVQIKGFHIGVYKDVIR
ncbi:MAG: hypothetical protein ACI9RO_000730 [Alteromonas macleodii]|jgi:hypothetical protein